MLFRYDYARAGPEYTWSAAAAAAAAAGGNDERGDQDAYAVVAGRTQTVSCK